MGLLQRANAGARFGADIVRAACRGTWETLHAPRPADAADDEVHLLVEGDPRHDLSPAARYRAVQFVPLLEAAGLRCRLWPARPGKYFTAGADWQSLHARWPHLAMVKAHLGHWRQQRARRSDFRALAGRGVVFLQRDLMALPGSRLERELPLYNRHIVFDFDDAIFVQPPWARGPGRDGIDRALRDKIAGICALSTAVIAANDHLAAFARQHTANVHVVPTVLCTDEFRPAAKPVPNARPVVGWVGTSGNLHYLRQIGPALQALAARRPFVLRIVCNRVDAAALHGLPDDLEFVEWRAEGEVERIQQFDVGIMPLDDDDWAAGKAGFKMVQYMACGVPFAASPVGANPATGGADGECGRYATTTAEWVERLDELLADATLRAQLGGNGRQRAVRRFDRRVHAATIAAILREVLRV
ncbi:MAG TPA: glycosyltransferase [Planctomycetota bacterium]|nr:glycosyltransferase [Planctomycetota bacterium]